MSTWRSRTKFGFLISEEEPRTLAEIIEAEQEYFDKVRYVRSITHDDTA